MLVRVMAPAARIVVVVQLLSHVHLFATLWTAQQAPLSMWILQTRILEWIAMPSSRSDTVP